MVSIVIPAHNEAAFLGRCLDAVLDDARPGEFEVIVAANGCADHTTDVARSRWGVRVVEIDRPGKAAALNRGDSLATRFPRIYLDADIPATTHAIRSLCAELERPGGPLVAVPSRRLDLTDRPVAVRAYCAVQQRLPTFEDRLFGRGLIALSEEGRSRFDHFPETIDDTLFLDRIFSADERVRLRDVTTTEATPLGTPDLLAGLVRVRRATTASTRDDAELGIGLQADERMSWLHDVVARQPSLAPAAAVYVGITAWVALVARLPAAKPRDTGETARAAMA